jgi:hypothetical protein
MVGRGDQYEGAFRVRLARLYQSRYLVLTEEDSDEIILPAAQWDGAYIP